MEPFWSLHKVTFHNSESSDWQLGVAGWAKQWSCFSLPHWLYDQLSLMNLLVMPCRLSCSPAACLPGWLAVLLMQGSAKALDVVLKTWIKVPKYILSCLQNLKTICLQFGTW